MKLFFVSLVCVLLIGCSGGTSMPTEPVVQNVESTNEAEMPPEVVVSYENGKFSFSLIDLQATIQN